MTSIVPRAEPEPDWKVVRRNIKWLWPFHYLTFGSSCLVLSLFSLRCIYRIINTKKKTSKRYFMTVASLLLIFGLTRGLYLLLDPYGSHVHFNLPTVAEAILRGVAYPCLTSSFTLVFLSLLDVTKFQLFPRGVQRIRVVAPILTLHFVIVTCSDVAGTVFSSAVLTTAICRAVFLLWGVFVFSSFLYAGVRLFNTFSSISGRLQDITAERRKLRRVQKRFGRCLPRVCKLTSIASLLGLVLCGLQVYSLHQMYRYLYISYITEEGKLWEWWICESLYRVTELAMGAFLCCIVHVPSKHKPHHVLSKEVATK